jgi:transposase
LDGDGFIRRHKIFNGKMTDAKSLINILKILEKDFEDKPMPTIVFDRGVVSEDNLKLLKEYDNLKYIIMCRSNDESKFTEDFQNDNNFKILEERDKKSKVEIFAKELKDEIYLLCRSEGRKAEETAMRNKAEKKLEDELKNLLKQIQNGRENNPVNIERRIGRFKERHGKVAKYYEIEYQHREFSYIVPDDVAITKRFSNSLKKLQEKADKSKISFPALIKKLAEFEEKHPHDYLKIKIHLQEPILT